MRKLTPKEAATIIGCAVTNIRLAIRQGKLEAEATPSPWGGYVYLIQEEELQRFASLPQSKSGFPRGSKRESSRGRKQ